MIKKGVNLYGFVTLAIAYFGGHVTWCDVWDCDNKSVVLVDVFLSRVGGLFLSLLREQISSSFWLDEDCCVRVFSMDLGG